MPDCRKAFTLLELLLVLALMVAALAVALPNIRGSFSDQRLQKAAEQVRAEWTRARVRAIKTGQTQVFRHTVYARNYVTTPLTSWEDELEASPFVSDSLLYPGGMTGANANTYSGNPLLQDPVRPNSLRSPGQGLYNGPLPAGGSAVRRWRELPKDVVFLGADVQLDQRSLSQWSTLPNDATLDLAALADEESQPLTETTSGTPVFFFPDGTTSTARLLLVNERQRVIEIWLRGLTGTVRVGPLQTLSPYASPEASRP